jgi:protein-S-isoprenylcysteine O-methyltransferase Ste14
MTSFLLFAPLFSILVLPTVWFEVRLLPKMAWVGWVVLIPLVNVLILYSPWIVAIIAMRHLVIGPLTILGFLMVAAGLLLLATSFYLILRVPGQMRISPQRLVVEGPYQWVRHPMYLSYFVLIGGTALACGALKVFLETPVLLGIVTIGGKYEESRILLPRFGKTFEQYKAKACFFLPNWGWALLGFIYSAVALYVFLV